jgi:hypothetical protein
MEEARLDWRRTGRAVGELLRENTPIFPLEEDYEPWNSSRPIFVAKYGYATSGLDNCGERMEWRSNLEVWRSYEWRRRD